MADKDMFYVEIHHPIDFRRSLLEASRDLLRALQKFEDLKKVREDKIKEVAKLKATVRDINSLLNQAKNHVPALNIKLPEPPKAEKKAKEEKKPAAHAHHAKKKDVKVQYKASREVTDLENQLKEIEGKLGSLG